MLLVPIFVFALLQGAQCHPAFSGHGIDAHDSVDRRDSRTVGEILNATVNAMGGIEALNSIDNFAYHASKYGKQLLVLRNDS